MKANYVAIFVAALAYWLLGAVWYGAIFQKPWMALEHVTPEMVAGVSPIAPYIISFVLNLVIAFVLAQIIAWRDANTAARGAAGTSGRRGRWGGITGRRAGRQARGGVVGAGLSAT